MPNPYRMSEQLNVTVATLGPCAPLSRDGLVEVLTWFPDYFPGIDPRRIPVPLIRIGDRFDRSIHQLNWLCECLRSLPIGDWSADSPPLYMPVDRPIVRLMHFRNMLIEGWLPCDVFLGQCKRCGRIYWR